MDHPPALCLPNGAPEPPPSPSAIFLPHPGASPAAKGKMRRLQGSGWRCGGEQHRAGAGAGGKVASLMCPSLPHFTSSGLNPPVLCLSWDVRGSCFPPLLSRGWPPPPRQCRSSAGLSLLEAFQSLPLPPWVPSSHGTVTVTVVSALTPPWWSGRRSACVFSLHPRSGEKQVRSASEATAGSCPAPRACRSSRFSPGPVWLYYPLASGRC